MSIVIISSSSLEPSMEKFLAYAQSDYFGATYNQTGNSIKSYTPYMYQNIFGDFGWIADNAEIKSNDNNKIIFFITDLLVQTNKVSNQANYEFSLQAITPNTSFSSYPFFNLTQDDNGEVSTPSYLSHKELKSTGFMCKRLSFNDNNNKGWLINVSGYRVEFN